MKCKSLEEEEKILKEIVVLGIVLDASPEELSFIQNVLGFDKADIDKFVKNYNTWIPNNKSNSGIFYKCP